jgi:arylsulfatase A-like enzyme
LVVFLSDNGGVLGDGANNGPWRSEKQHVYEGGIRVPLAVRWPGRVRPASVSDRQVLSMDLFPTLLQAAGAPAQAGVDGVGFLPTLLGDASPGPERDLYFVRREGWDAYGGKTIEALRRGKWKLIQDSPYAPLELYDLEADPGESRNLVHREPKVVRELAAALRRHIQEAGRVPWQPPAPRGE